MSPVSFLPSLASPADRFSSCSPCAFFISSSQRDCLCALLGQIGGLINQICHSNLGVTIFFFVFIFFRIFFCIFTSAAKTAERGQAERAMKCVKAAEKIFKGSPAPCSLHFLNPQPSTGLAAMARAAGEGTGDYFQGFEVVRKKKTLNLMKKVS